MTNNETAKKVMTLAHSIRREAQANFDGIINFSECLKLAWVKIKDAAKKMTSMAIAEGIIAKVAKINQSAANSCRIWAKGDHVRIYSGGQGYVAINTDGTTDKVKNQDWGHVIVDAL